MSEIIPHPHSVRLRTGHTTSRPESWRRLLSLSLFSFLFYFPTYSLLPGDQGLGVALSSYWVLAPKGRSPEAGAWGAALCFLLPGALSVASGGRGRAASYLCFSLGRLTSLSPLPTRPPFLCAHGL